MNREELINNNVLIAIASSKVESINLNMNKVRVTMRSGSTYTVEDVEQNVRDYISSENISMNDAEFNCLLTIAVSRSVKRLMTDIVSGKKIISCTFNSAPDAFREMKAEQEKEPEYMSANVPYVVFDSMKYVPIRTVDVKLENTDKVLLLRYNGCTCQFPKTRAGYVQALEQARSVMSFSMNSCETAKDKQNILQALLSIDNMLKEKRS